MIRDLNEPSEFELVVLKRLNETSLPLFCSGSIWEFQDGSRFAVDYGTIERLRGRGWIHVTEENGGGDKRESGFLTDCGRKAFAELQPAYEFGSQQKREEGELQALAREKRARQELGRKGIYLAEHKGIWLKGLWWLR